MLWDWGDVGRCSNVVAFLIQNVAIAHLKEAEGTTGRRLRSVGIGMVVASLFLFAVGITVAAKRPAMPNICLRGLNYCKLLGCTAGAGSCND